MSINHFPTNAVAIDIEKLRAGEPASFHHLYQTCFHELYNETKVLIKDPAAAVALVNHCFIKCWLRSQEFSSLKHLVGFLNYTVRIHRYNFINAFSFRSAQQDLILKQILEGSTKQACSARLNSPYPERIGPVREIFSRFYEKKWTTGAIAKDLGLETGYVQKCLEMAFECLYLIFAVNKM